MKHPNPALVQASHSVLVSFLSSKPKDSKGCVESDRDSILAGYNGCRECDRDPIKEQLAVRFIERTFEVSMVFLSCLFVDTALVSSYSLLLHVGFFAGASNSLPL